VPPSPPAFLFPRVDCGGFDDCIKLHTNPFFLILFVFSRRVSLHAPGEKLSLFLLLSRLTFAVRGWRVNALYGAYQPPSLLVFFSGVYSFFSPDLPLFPYSPLPKCNPPEFSRAVSGLKVGLKIDCPFGSFATLFRHGISSKDRYALFFSCLPGFPRTSFTQSRLLRFLPPSASFG